MTVNRTRQCGQVLEAQDGNGVPIPTVVPTGAAPVRALQDCVLAREAKIAVNTRDQRISDLEVALRKTAKELI